MNESSKTQSAPGSAPGLASAREAELLMALQQVCATFKAELASVGEQMRAAGLQCMSISPTGKAHFDAIERAEELLLDRTPAAANAVGRGAKEIDDLIRAWSPVNANDWDIQQERIRARAALEALMQYAPTAADAGGREPDGYVYTYQLANLKEPGASGLAVPIHTGIGDVRGMTPVFFDRAPATSAAALSRAAKGPYTEVKQAAIERGECKARDTMELCKVCRPTGGCIVTVDAIDRAAAKGAAGRGGEPC